MVSNASCCSDTVLKVQFNQMIRKISNIKNIESIITVSVLALVT